MVYILFLYKNYLFENTFLIKLSTTSIQLKFINKFQFELFAYIHTYVRTYVCTLYICEYGWALIGLDWLSDPSPTNQFNLWQHKIGPKSTKLHGPIMLNQASWFSTDSCDLIQLETWVFLPNFNSQKKKKVCFGDSTSLVSLRFWITGNSWLTKFISVCRIKDG